MTKEQEGQEAQGEQAAEEEREVEKEEKEEEEGQQEEEPAGVRESEQRALTKKMGAQRKPRCTNLIHRFFSARTYGHTKLPEGPRSHLLMKSQNVLIRC